MEINRDLNSSHIEDNVSFRYENVLNSTLGMGGESDTIGISSPGIIGDLEGKYSEQGSDCSSVTSDSIPLRYVFHSKFISKCFIKKTFYSSGKHRVIRNLRCANSKAINDVRDDYDRLKRKLDGLEVSLVTSLLNGKLSRNSNVYHHYGRLSTLKNPFKF